MCFSVLFYCVIFAVAVFLLHAGRLAEVEEELEQKKAAGELAQQALNAKHEEVRRGFRPAAGDIQTGWGGDREIGHPGRR